MSFLDDLEGNLRSRINRVNPDASIEKAPTNRSFDWLKNSIDVVKRYASDRDTSLADNQRSRFLENDWNAEDNARSRSILRDQEVAAARKRFIDSQTGSNIGSFDDRALGRVAVARSDPDKFKKSGVFGSLKGLDDSSAREIGSDYRQKYGDYFGGVFDREQVARDFIDQSLRQRRETGEAPLWLQPYRLDFEMNNGRGVKWSDWEKMAEDDPVGFLAAAEPRTMKLLPEPVQALVAERQQSGNVPTYMKNRELPGEHAIRSATRFLPDNPAFQIPREIAAGLSRSFETQGSAVAQAGFNLVGQHQRAQNVDRNVGTNFGDMTGRQKLGVALDSLATDASFVVPGAFGSGIVSKVLGRELTPLEAKIASFAIGAITNLGYDVPTTYAALKLQGYSDEDIKRVLPMAVAGDLFGAGVLGTGASTGAEALRRVPFGRELGSAAGTGLATYGLQRGFGIDNDEATKNSVLLAAAALGAGGLRGIGEKTVGRLGITRELPDDYRLQHGTTADFAEPRVSARGELGRGFYTTPEETGRGELYAKESKAMGRPGEPKVMDIRTEGASRYLEALEEVTPEELSSIRSSLARLTNNDEGALSTFDKAVNDPAFGGRPANGNRVYSALDRATARMKGEVLPEHVIVDSGIAGMTSPRDSYGVGRQFSHFDTSSISTEGQRNSRLMATIDAFRRIKPNTDIQPGDPRRGGLAPLPKARTKVEQNIDQLLERFRGEDGKLHMSGDDIYNLWREATGGKTEYPGFVPRLSLDDMRTAFEEGLPGSKWYDRFAEMIDEITDGDRGGDASKATLSRFAVTSQQAPPTVNLIKMFNAMAAINKLTDGGRHELDLNAFEREVGEGTPDGMDAHQIKKLTQLYNEGWTATTSPGAAKTPTYYNNLLDSLLKRYSAGVTVDTHHGAFFGFFDKKMPDFDLKSGAMNKNNPAYVFAQRITQHLAAEYGVEPKVAQAAMWETMKKVKEADDGQIADAFNRGDLDWREAVELSRGYLATGGHENAFSDPKVQEAMNRFFDSVERYGDAPATGELKFAPKSKTGVAEERFGVSEAQGATARAEVAAKSPVVEFSTKPGALGREADPRAQIALQRERLRSIGFSEDLRSHEDLDRLGIRFEPIEESMGSWQGAEPNLRLRIVGGNNETAELAAAVIAKRLQQAGLAQDAMAIHLPASQVATTRGFELAHPSGGEWTPEDFIKLEQAAYENGIGVTLKLGDKTRAVMNQYEDFLPGEEAFINGAVETVRQAGYRPDKMEARSADSYLLFGDDYDSTLERLGPRHDPDGTTIGRLRGADAQPNGEGLGGPAEGPSGGQVGGGSEGNRPPSPEAGAGGPRASIVDGGNPFADPEAVAKQMAAQGAAGAIYGYMNPQDDQTRSESAAIGASSALLSPLTRMLQRKAGVAARAGIDSEKGFEGEITPEELRKALPKSQAQINAERSQRLKDAAKAKLDELTDRRTKAAAPPEAIKAFEKDADDYVAHAEATLGDVNAVRRVLKEVPGLGTVLKGVDSLVDPASNFSGYYGRRVLTSTLAAANFMRTQAGFQSVRVRELEKSLAPFLGSQPHLKNAVKQAVAFGAPAAAGEVATELTGDDKYREAGILTGIGATAFLSGRQKMTKWNNRLWETVALKSPELAQELPEGIRSGSGKLYDILQNPDRYDLNPEQSQAILDYQVLREQMVKDTNAALAAAGMDEIITPREMHGILQWFEPDSLEKAGLGETGRKGFRIETPGFDRLRAMQLHRDLGPSFEAALKEHGELVPIKDPEALLSLEVKMHDQIRANALLVRSLKDSGIAIRVPGEAEYKSMGEDAKAYKALVQFRERAGWQKLPGIDDYLFHQNAVKAVDDLLMPSRGRDSGPIALADMVTNVMRQAMFTSDASAWTMQGAMLAINDPIGTILNAKHLVGATVFGRKYFDKWVQENPEIWKNFTKASGVGGLEHEGLEKEGLTLSKLPFVGHIEQRGFEAFLPIHRALMHQNIAAEERFVSRLYGKDILGAKRLAANALKNGPAALGIGAALTGVDIPGVDDNWEKAFLIALGVGGSVAGREAVNKLSGEETIASRVSAAKQVNRTSGAFNRQAYGITAEQAQWERTLMARSPALLRNTIILANKAATDFGPEGAMARFYLVKTAALMGAGLAAAQWAATGKMPSLDPTDPDSILNPQNANFMRAEGNEAGRFTASNPLISLVKAFMRVDTPDGVKKWRSQDWVPILGLTDWYQARQSDLFGPAIGAAVSEAGGALQRKAGESAGIGDGATARTFKDSGFQLPVPLVLRGVFESGLAGKTETGKLIKPITDAVGLKPDSAFTNNKERVAGVGATFLGLNATPETLSRELLRIKTETVNKQFPGLTDRNKDGVVDYNDLNDEQQEGVRGQLNANGRYQQAVGTVEKLGEGEPPNNIQRYFDAIAKVNTDYETTMQGIDSDYKAKNISAFEAKSFYQQASEVRRDALKAARDLYGALPAERKGTNETVTQYLQRDLKGEDAAVQGYYDLYEQATGRDGKLDFNTLEKLQAKYLNSLSSSDRAYVERRVASFDKPQTTQFGRDYENAKALTQPYWDASERAFSMVANKGVFKGFNTYADFEDAVNQYASAKGVAPDAILSSLSSDPAYKMFQKRLEFERFKLVNRNPNVGTALVDFYGRTPPKGTKSYMDYKLFQRKNGMNIRSGYGLEDFSE